MAWWYDVHTDWSAMLMVVCIVCFSSDFGGTLVYAFGKWIQNTVHNMHKHEPRLALSDDRNKTKQNKNTHTQHQTYRAGEREMGKKAPSRINNNMSKICKQNGILMHEAIILCSAYAIHLHISASKWLKQRVTLNDGKCEPNHKQPLH